MADLPPRQFDIPLGESETITLDLNELDPDPTDLLSALEEARCPVWVWTKLAGEYWRSGDLDVAERIGQTARELFQGAGDKASLPPVYALLANLKIARARKAPKLIMELPKLDDLRTEKSKEYYHDEATALLNQADRATTDAGQAATSLLSFLTRGVTQLATYKLDEALRSFDGVLAIKPTNIVALIGKARILYARRQFPRALQHFQQVLQYSPYSLPDPRIGIGLCYWSMDQKAKAKAAWERSIEVHPKEWPAKLLLGLDGLNSIHDDTLTDAQRTQAILAAAKGYLEPAFNANQRNASAANALCQLMLQKRESKKAMKLAERTIQFADTRTVLTDGYTRAGRLANLEGSYNDAERYFTQATSAQPTVVASIGLAQVQIKNDLIVSAIHTLDKLLETPNQKSLEATAMLASLKAQSRSGVSASEQTKNHARAKELFDIVCKAVDNHLQNEQFNGNASHSAASKPQRWLLEDIDMHAEVAKLWQGENLTRAKRALEHGQRLGGNNPDPRILNNLAVIHHMEGDFGTARRTYEQALTQVNNPGISSELTESMSTTILYNLAREYEVVGLDDMAKEAYSKLLTRHPEYIDAKIRQADMLLKSGGRDEAHELVKEALTAQTDNLDLRAFYTHFLIETNQLKVAKNFVWQTLQAHDKHDVYSLCATAWIQYHQARETREAKLADKRKEGFNRAAEFYEKALQLDPQCVLAAQGLAIITAEDALGTLGGALPPGPQPDDNVKRLNNARDALDVFSKVRECLDDGSVYLNMGHCYFARDEFDRAIESYETASKRYYDSKNVAALTCLYRSWYAKATKDQSFTAITTALEFAHEAAKLAPSDKSITYNIAMLEQKAAELLYNVAPAKRSLADLTQAIEQAQHAQQLFAQLAADTSSAVPYSREVADQRRKYGESLLRKADDHLSSQKTYEEEARTKLDAARQRREAERARVKEAEDARLAELRAAADKLAEQRRADRQEAQQWTRAVEAESDEEREKKAERVAKRAARKQKTEDGTSGDEGDDGPKEPKKRRIRKKKGEDAADGEEALFSADEGETKPKKRKTKKQNIVKDEDDEEAVGSSRKKQIKSKEVIEDSDEEMGDA